MIVPIRKTTRDVPHERLTKLKLLRTKMCRKARGAQEGAPVARKGSTAQKRTCTTSRVSVGTPGGSVGGHICAQLLLVGKSYFFTH